MRYIALFLLLFLSSCAWYYQSKYPELKREVITRNPAGIVTIGSVNSGSTFLFGRLKVYDKHKDRDITRHCLFKGLSNKYFRLSGDGAMPSNPRHDSIFYNTNPANNLHVGTGLFGVHAKEGLVGVHFTQNNGETDFNGGIVKCRRHGKEAVLSFTSRIPYNKTKTYIGDFTLTFTRGNNYDFKVEDKLEETYKEFVSVVPSAANKDLKLVKSLAKHH